LFLVIQLNALLGKKGRYLKDFNDYWDVATFFELHAVQHDWPKACQAALHMYLLNPPIWYLKSTINNLKILHQATRIHGPQKPREQSQMITADEDVYRFWIDFFSDAVNSNSISSELPAQVPVCFKKEMKSFLFSIQFLFVRFLFVIIMKKLMEQH
jgi:mitogen-activated protein kinase kinase kinase 5